MADDEAPPQVTCSFCGKNQRQVKKIIAGPNVWICDECIELSTEIIAEEATESVSDVMANVPSPRELFEQLSSVVVGQTAALRMVSLAVYRHYETVRMRREQGLRMNKDNVLMIGPTGSGKTLIARELARILNVPIALADASTLTESGYIGEDVESLLNLLVSAAGYDVARAEMGIVFLDEVDKLARKSLQSRSLTRDVGGEGVQQALLMMMGGKTARFTPGVTRKHPQAEMTEINTTDILFICSGSFEGIDQIVTARKQAMGSDRTAPRFTPVITPAEVTQLDLEAFGLLPEFAGRLTTITQLQPLNAADLERLLRESEESVITEYQRLFDRNGVSLHFTDEAVSAVATQAIHERSGARGLRRVVERTLSDALFFIAGGSEAVGCTVTDRAVNGEAQPDLVDDTGAIVNLHRNKVFLSYSRKDAEYLAELRSMLAPLVRNGTVDVWFDGDIKPSANWREEVRKALESTRVAVLLVSPNFLASDFVIREELPYFLRMADKGGVKILWILLGDCLFEETELSDYQAAHDIAKPLDTLDPGSRRAVWAKIARVIRSTADTAPI
jgi:ATP-dependent Clp protease ATP-binding subunit ClpX